MLFAGDAVEEFDILSAVNRTPILLGTSSFTASGWNGSFYPRGLKPSDYLRFYAERFHTVEVDSTFYACPTARTVENWNARTPDAINTETFACTRQG